MKKRSFGTWVSAVITFVLLILAAAPGAFNVPMMLRPWLFLASVIWMIVFSSGVLSS